MKYVYIIMTGCVGDEHVHEIFSSEKKANEILNLMLKDRYWKTTDPHVEKWEVK